MSEMSKCNTGISFLLHNIYSNFVALITILHKTGNKKKSTPTSGDHVSLIPLDFAVRVHPVARPIESK